MMVTNINERFVGHWGGDTSRYLKSANSRSSVTTLRPDGRKSIMTARCRHCDAARRTVEIWPT